MVEISDRETFWVYAIFSVFAIVASSRHVLRMRGVTLLFVVAIAIPALLVIVDSSFHEAVGGPFLHNLFPSLICALRGGEFCPVETAKSTGKFSSLGAASLIAGSFVSATVLLRLVLIKSGSEMTRLVIAVIAGGVYFSCALRLVDAFGTDAVDAALSLLPPKDAAALVDMASQAQNSLEQIKLLVASELAGAARVAAKAFHGLADKLGGGA